jgi:Uma2 family endonuclease
MISRRKWTVEDLKALEAAGRLDPEKRFELMDGEVYEMPPIGEGHSGKVNWLNTALGAQFAGRAIISVQNPVELGADNLVYPDVALLKPRADFYESSYAQPADILLAIEVAQTSQDYDHRKLQTYAKAEVREIWIVDLPARCTEVYRNPVGSDYLLRQLIPAGQAIYPLAFPNNPVTPL